MDTMSRCYAYIVAYISRLEIGNVVLRPARLEVGHYDTAALYARTSTARTMHVWAAPYKMYEAPYILPYMTGNFRPTAQTQKPTVCLNFRPQYKSIVYFSLKGRYRSAYDCSTVVQPDFFPGSS